MNVKKLVQGLSHLGKVDGKRQTYYVFQGNGFFLVLSFSKTKRQAGNFNIVDSEAVEYVRDRFRGKKAVTSKDVVARSKRSKHARTSLIALNILYVLAAMGDLSVDATRADPKLYFNFKSGRTGRQARRG